MRGKASFDGVAERSEHGWRVFSVADPNALTQVVGWLKFTSEDGLALYRGQSGLYAEMAATGFRGLSDRGHSRLAEQMRLYVDNIFGSTCKCEPQHLKFSQSHLCGEQLKGKTGAKHAIVAGAYRSAIEPLLQHYGLRTRWLDVVDNIWIALWFACHTQVTSGRYAHHRRRSAAQEGGAAKAYIYVFETGSLEATEVPGYQIGKSARVVDLRYSVPSVYLRPHAQHGVLMAPAQILANSSGSLGSLKSQVAGVIEINLADALDWLGTGGMTSGHVLFPPATRDEGYRRLLDWTEAPPAGLGAITHYGPGN
jgi:hypothetical protein